MRRYVPGVIRDLSVLGRALAAPARSEIVSALMDGSSRPAGELAAGARISAATASQHLALLLEVGLLRCETRGRQRFYRLADDRVARALENLGQLCPVTSPSGGSRPVGDLVAARLCYDHLAGRLGVQVHDALRRHAWLDAEQRPTAAGERALGELGIDLAALRRLRRPLVRTCPDWTERRAHLGGALGAALATRCLEQGWVRRRPTGRGLQVTRPGEQALAVLLAALPEAPHDLGQPSQV